MPHMDVTTVAIVVGAVFSVLFGLYEHFDKRKLVKLQSAEATSNTDKNVVEAQGIVAKNLVEVVQLMMSVMNTFKEELASQFKEGFTSLHGTIEEHTKQDEERFKDIARQLDTVIKHQ